MCAGSMLKDKLSINNKPQDFVKSDITSEKSYILYDKLYCNIQEIAFNYISNFIKAKLTYRGKYKYLLNLESYKGLLFIKQILKQKEYAFYENLYEEYLSYIMEYVYSRAESIENLFGKTSQQIELNAYKKYLHNSSSYDYVYKLDKEKLIKYEGTEKVPFGKLDLKNC